MLVNSGRRWLFGYICHFVISFLIHKFHFKKKKISLQRSLLAGSALPRCSFSMKNNKNWKREQREAECNCQPVQSLLLHSILLTRLVKWNWICRILSVWLHEMFSHSFYRQFPCGHACLRKNCKHVLLGVQWSLKKGVSLLPPILQNVHT